LTENGVFRQFSLLDEVKKACCIFKI